LKIFDKKGKLLS